MATPVPNGNPDSFFINRVRRELKDSAVTFGPETTGTDGITGVVAANSKPFRTARNPVVPFSMALTAPSPTNMGIVAWTPIYNLSDPAPIVPAVISDGGAGGTLLAGTYFVAYTYVTASGETFNGPGSNGLTIAANRLINVAALTGLPASVLSVKFYLLPTTAGASAGGYLGAVVPVGGATGVFQISAAGNGNLNVNVNPETGEINFPSPPAVGTLSMQYQATRFSDQQIKDALAEGLASLWPEIWQEDTNATLIPVPYSYEYTLPAPLQDPRVVILKLEVRDPNIPTIPWREYNGWERVGLTTLALYDLRFSAAGVIRLTYNAPYVTLSDVEPQAMWLPVYYALHRLLVDQENYRERADEMPSGTQEGIAPVGAAQNLSAYWLSLYEMGKKRLMRAEPVHLRMAEAPHY